VFTCPQLGDALRYRSECRIYKERRKGQLVDMEFIESLVYIPMCMMCKHVGSSNYSYPFTASYATSIFRRARTPPHRARCKCTRGPA
jgi:hypothetical protein